MARETELKVVQNYVELFETIGRYDLFEIALLMYVRVYKDSKDITTKDIEKIKDILNRKEFEYGIFNTNLLETIDQNFE